MGCDTPKRRGWLILWYFIEFFRFFFLLIYHHLPTWCFISQYLQVKIYSLNVSITRMHTMPYDMVMSKIFLVLKCWDEIFFFDPDAPNGNVWCYFCGHHHFIICQKLSCDTWLSPGWREFVVYLIIFWIKWIFE